MELEKLLELMENTKAFKTNPACEQLAEHFKTLADLHYQQKDGIATPEYFEKFGKTFKLFWDSFDQAAESVGLSPEALRANLHNPSFFHPDQWKAMQAIKQEISGKKPIEPKPKKSRANKKRVRI